MNTKPGGTNGEPPYSFGRARVAAGLFIVAVVGVLLLIDAWSETFAVDAIQLALMLGSGLLLLGVDAGRKLLGGP